jgi:hypothetical protein
MFLLSIIPPLTGRSSLVLPPLIMPRKSIVLLPLIGQPLHANLPLHVTSQTVDQPREEAP